MLSKRGREGNAGAKGREEEEEEEDSLPLVRVCISSSKGSGTLLYWPGAEDDKLKDEQEEEEVSAIIWQAGEAMAAGKTLGCWGATQAERRWWGGCSIGTAVGPLAVEKVLLEVAPAGAVTLSKIGGRLPLFSSEALLRGLLCVDISGCDPEERGKVVNSCPSWPAPRAKAAMKHARA